jgi:C1A family cysteine protease
MSARAYGWKRDRAGDRDRRFGFMYPAWAFWKVPAAASVLAVMPPVWDQGQLNGCTGHGCPAIVMAARARAGLTPVMLSRLMAYYLGRAIEGTIAEDAGAEIRDVIRGMARSGCCPEADWPYQIQHFDVTPPADAWTAALADCIKGYSRLDNADLLELKTCIAGGDPFVFGFDVPASFEGEAIAASGFLEMPVAGWTPVGAHCVAAVAYDDAMRGPGWQRPGGFLIRNSWGTWGDPAHPGHFWMPYDFISGPACSDFWHVTSTGYGPSRQA